MPVPSNITDLSTSPGSNSPSGSESITTVDDYLRTLAAFIAQLRDGKAATTGTGATGTWPISITGTAANATTAVTATKLAGGVAGGVAYQSAVGTTAFSAAGTAGQALVSGGTGAPLWQPVGVPAGAVMPFAMSAAPAGWLAANGAAVSRSTYAALFSAIGTTYGAGDGSTTFNLPDLRGEFVRGWDAGRGVDAGRGMGSAQGDELRAHSHIDGTKRIWDAADGEYGTNTRGTVDSPVARYTNGTAAYDLDNTSTTGGAETRPRNVALMYCIKT